MKTKHARWLMHGNGVMFAWNLFAGAVAFNEGRWFGLVSFAVALFCLSQAIGAYYTIQIAIAEYERDQLKAQLEAYIADVAKKLKGGGDG